MTDILSWLNKGFARATQDDKWLQAVDCLAPQVQAICLARNNIRYRDINAAKKLAAEMIEDVAKYEAKTGGMSITDARCRLIDIIVQTKDKTTFLQMFQNAKQATVKARAEGSALLRAVPGLRG